MGIKHTREWWTPQWLQVYKAARSEGGWVVAMYGNRKLEKNGDLPRFQGCGETVCPSSAALEKWNTFVARTHAIIRQNVKDEVQMTPWGELYGFLHPHNKTAADFILARGRESAKKRLQALVFDAYQILQKKMYYDAELVSTPLNSPLRPAIVKDADAWKHRYESTMDLIRGLRSRYSLTTPPSVPAPSASTTEAGSGDTSEPAPVKIRVKRRLVPSLPEDQPEDSVCEDRTCAVDHTK